MKMAVASRSHSRSSLTRLARASFCASYCVGALCAKGASAPSGRRHVHRRIIIGRRSPSRCSHGSALSKGRRTHPAGASLLCVPAAVTSLIASATIHLSAANAAHEYCREWPAQSRVHPNIAWSAPLGWSARVLAQMIASLAWYHNQSGTMRKCGISRVQTSSGEFRTFRFSRCGTIRFKNVWPYSSTPRYIVRLTQLVTSVSRQSGDRACVTFGELLIFDPFRNTPRYLPVRNSYKQLVNNRLLLWVDFSSKNGPLAGSLSVAGSDGCRISGSKRSGAAPIFQRPSRFLAMRNRK